MIDPTLQTSIFRDRLRELCAHHHRTVRLACRRYVQNPDDAEDLAQEVLVKAARAWPGFAGRCADATWIHRVARNHCADHHRVARRRDAMHRLYAAGLPDPHAGGGAEDFPVLAGRLWDRLRDGLEGGDRHLAHLCFELGMKQIRIARMTGTPRPTITRRLLGIRRRAERLWEELLSRDRQGQPQ